MQRDALPNASILRDVTPDQWESVAAAYKVKVAFVCCQNHVSPKLPQEILQRIGAFI